MIIDKLLTRYEDSRIRGERIDVEALLLECPVKDRDELKRLIIFREAFKNSCTNYEVTPTFRRHVLAKMEQIFKENRSVCAGIAARTKHQNVANQQKLENKLAEIRSRFKKED